MSIHPEVSSTDADSAGKAVASLIADATERPINGDILAVIVPGDIEGEHGPLAADVYACLKAQEPYETVMVVSPSRTGRFRRMTIPGADVYRSAAGDFRIDDTVRNELCDEDDDFFVDDTGQYADQGALAQIPFLKAALDDFKIVPVVMGEESPDFCRELATALGEIMFNRRTLVLATATITSGDAEGLSHLAQLLMDRDADRLLQFLTDGEVVVEGKGAVVSALQAALYRRATDVEILGVRPPSNDGPGALAAIVYRKK